jgi:hypothetical protein
VTPTCVVPGRPSPGKHRLGVRCRVWHEPSPVAGKHRTDALWAPDADVFLCDDHAMGGMNMTLLVEPNGAGENSQRVVGAAHGAPTTEPTTGQ